MHEMVGKMERLNGQPAEYKALRADMIDSVLSRVHELSYFSPLFLLASTQILRPLQLETRCLAVTAPNLAPGARSRQARLQDLLRHGSIFEDENGDGNHHSFDDEHRSE